MPPQDAGPQPPCPQRLSLHEPPQFPHQKSGPETFSKSCKSRTVRHSRCHGYQLWMGFPQLAQLSGKYLCIGGFLLFPIFFSRCNIKRTHTVKYGRILLRRFISLSLFVITWIRTAWSNFLASLRTLHRTGILWPSTGPR